MISWLLDLRLVWPGLILLGANGLVTALVGRGAGRLSYRMQPGSGACAQRRWRLRSSGPATSAKATTQKGSPRLATTLVLATPDQSGEDSAQRLARVRSAMKSS